MLTSFMAAMPESTQRVAVVIAAVVTLLAVGLPLRAMAGEMEPGRSMNVIKERYIQHLLDRGFDTARTRTFMDELSDEGYWPRIDYDDLSRGAFENQQHLHRMLDMALAHRHADSPLHGDGQLLEKLLLALDYWLAEDFQADNWWHNEMGTPRRLTWTLLLIHDQLTAQQMDKGMAIISRANLDGFGARPGGDLVQIADIMVQRGVLSDDAQLIEQAVDAIADELQFRTGRGVQHDWSLHHRDDGAKNTTDYGTGYAGAVAGFARKAAGTAFALPEDQLEFITNFYLDGVRWSLGHGVYRIPATMNRNLSRPGAISAHATGIARDLLDAEAPRSDELRMVLDVAENGSAPAWQGHHAFWRSDTVAHQRPGFHVAVRMHSSRNTNTENTYNHEGLMGHHLADGHYSITRTGEEYRDLPGAWDWQKLPGTTVLQKDKLENGSQVRQSGRRDFVGGVSDGTYGAAAFDFESAHHPLSARKAWFFFDEGFVGLGAGIQSDAAEPVVTTLNQSRLVGSVIVGERGSHRTLREGDHELANIDWVHHDQTGYLFFEPVTLKLENQLVENRWQRANRQTAIANREPARERIFRAWLDHGSAPTRSAYAYMVLPGAGVAELEKAARDAPVEVLVSSRDQQAVRHKHTGLVQAVFYEAGRIAWDDQALSVSEPCIVMLRIADGTIDRMTVADPTQSLQTLTVTVRGQLEGKDVAWDQRAGKSRVDVKLPQGALAGKSVVREWMPDE